MPVEGVLNPNNCYEVRARFPAVRKEAKGDNDDNCSLRHIH